MEIGPFLCRLGRSGIPAATASPLLPLTCGRDLAHAETIGRVQVIAGVVAQRFACAHPSTAADLVAEVPDEQEGDVERLVWRGAERACWTCIRLNVDFSVLAEPDGTSAALSTCSVDDHPSGQVFVRLVVCSILSPGCTVGVGRAGDR